MVCACSLKAEVKVKRGGLWVSDLCTYCKTVPDGRLWENCIYEQTLRMPMPLIRVALMRIMFCNIKIMVRCEQDDNQIQQANVTLYHNS